MNERKLIKSMMLAMMAHPSYVDGSNQEFIDHVDSAKRYLKEKIDGRCPKCGGELEYSHTDRVLLSNPHKRQINCTECAHVGYLTIERSKE